jgi:tetratricopeptide (TPR) repeat protein
MPVQHDQEKKARVSSSFAQFIQRYRLFLVILGVGVILFPIVFWVVATISNSIFEAATLQAYSVEKKYDEYKQATDPDKKATIEKDLFKLLQETADKYGNMNAGARALYIRATINYEKSSTAAAKDKKDLITSTIGDFTRVAENAGGSFMAPLSLMQAANIVQNIPFLIPEDTTTGLLITIDEITNVIPKRFVSTGGAKPESFNDVALALYKNVADNYAKSIYIAEALINMGALLEAKGKYKEAGDIYGKLESEYANNDWTKVAINRKIKLQADGLLTN